jgi:hypothetical protein
LEHICKGLWWIFMKKGIFHRTISLLIFSVCMEEDWLEARTLYVHILVIAGNYNNSTGIGHHKAQNVHNSQGTKRAPPVLCADIMLGVVGGRHWVVIYTPYLLTALTYV